MKKLIAALILLLVLVGCNEEKYELYDKEIDLKEYEISEYVSDEVAKDSINVLVKVTSLLYGDKEVDLIEDERLFNYTRKYSDKNIESKLSYSEKKLVNHVIGLLLDANEGKVNENSIGSDEFYRLLKEKHEWDK